MVFLLLLKQISKISFLLALISISGAFIIGWIGFSVPDWASFERSFLSQNKFGLWSYCTNPLTASPSGFSCSSWSKNNISTPDFLRSVQGLITIGMIFVTFTVIIAFLAVFLRSLVKPLLIAACVTSFISLLFIFIGIVVFAGDYNDYITGFGGTNVYRRWGYWIFSAVMILLILAFILFPFSVIFEKLLSRRYERTRREKIAQKNAQKILAAQASANIQNSEPKSILVPSVSNPGLLREYKTSSNSNFTQIIMPPRYEVSESTPVPKRAVSSERSSSIPKPKPPKKRTKEPKTIVREVIEPIYFKEPLGFTNKNFDNEGIRDVSTYDFSRDLKDRTVILPGESDKVRYQRNYKEEPARKLAQSSDEKIYDWQKVRNQ